MQGIFSFLRSLCWAAACLSVNAFSTTLSVIDARDKVISLERPANRIISLAPHITELVYAAGAGDLLVGVSSMSDYPREASRIPVIGNFSAIDLERIVQLKPDLVIAWQTGNANLDLRKFERLGIPIYLTETRTLEDIPKIIRDIGQLSGRATDAELTATQFTEELAKIKSRRTLRWQLKVFYEVWHEPFMTVNGKHSISNVITRCGGVNIFSDLKMLIPRISIEDILMAQPDAIVTTRALPDAIKTWSAYPALNAVKANHIFSIPADYLHRATPRILEGARRLCAYLDSVTE